MVKRAMLLPSGVVEGVAHRHGELSIEAVRETYREEEIDRLQIEARDGDGESTVLAALDEHEMERVKRAASEAGENPSVWLLEATLDVVDDRGPVARPETLAEQIERVIMRRAPV
jgi:hypothetical protein